MLRGGVGRQWRLVNADWNGVKTPAAAGHFKADIFSNKL